MRVSILINNFNYRRFVARAIESALRQSHSDVEVIVVDDGSTDGSLAEIERFGERVQVVAKANGGQGSAYNEGFRRSSGGLVIFLDADDWLYPQAAAQVAQAWRPGVSKLQFPLELVDADGLALGRQVPRHMHDHQALALLTEFATYGSPPGSGNAYARSFLTEVLPMDEAAWRIAADSVPILLAPAYGEVLSLPVPLGAYRQHRRSADDGSLVGFNAAQTLWHEYDCILDRKRLVVDALVRLGRPPQSPPRLAPWEARLVAMCVRFGGARLPQAQEMPSGGALRRQALSSIWRWPLSGLPTKALVSVWMVCIWFLPNRLAFRFAQMNRASTGAASAS